MNKPLIHLDTEPATLAIGMEPGIQLVVTVNAAEVLGKLVESGLEPTCQQLGAELLNLISDNGKASGILAKVNKDVFIKDALKNIVDKHRKDDE